jgi:hypothetical protein
LVSHRRMLTIVWCKFPLLTTRMGHNQNVYPRSIWQHDNMTNVTRYVLINWLVHTCISGLLIYFALCRLSNNGLFCNILVGISYYVESCFFSLQM